LRANPDKIDWEELSSNTSPNAIDLLRANPEKINWDWLSFNPNAMDLLQANPDKIDWEVLSSNTSPNAIDLLRANPDKIDWDEFSANPAIFELDYQKMKESKREINQAIIAEVWHPNRIARWIEQEFDLENF